MNFVSENDPSILETYLRYYEEHINPEDADYINYFKVFKDYILFGQVDTLMLIEDCWFLGQGYTELYDQNKQRFDEVEKYFHWLGRRSRFIEICIAMKSLDLPALIQLEILNASYKHSYLIPTTFKYDLIRMVKHSETILSNDI